MLTNSTSQNTLLFIVLGERLSFTKTALNVFERGTRGELHHTQTPALDRSAVWNKSLILFHEIGSLRDFYIMTLFANCKVIMRTTIARILCTVNSLPMIISEGFSGRKKILAKSIFH